jgi:glucose/arabinose dehydrogenase
MNRILAIGSIFLASLFLPQASAQTTQSPPSPPTVPYNPDYGAVQEGKPVDNRPPEVAGGKPVFPGQTRAPYHGTAPYKLTEITGGLHAPWGLAFLPDGKFLVAERAPGAFRVVSPDGRIGPPLTGFEALGITWPEIGLFDFVLDPGFAKNHQIYFTFFALDRGMIGGIQVARATFDQGANALHDVKVIFRTRPSTPSDNNPGFGARSGGSVALGPDGFLYITIGDRDAGTSFPWRVAQTLDTDLGKIIRITKDGKPAPGNPFIGREDALPEIWAIGQRSQEGLTFDAQGNLWETEHGPRGGDELNLIRRGANYGWPIISHGIDYPGPRMGDAEVARPGMEQPAYYWSPSTAPSGLAYYNADLFPEWKGSLLAGMLRGNSIERLAIRDGKVVNEEPLLTELHLRIRTVKVGPDGAIYALTDSGNNDAGSFDKPPATSKLVKLTPK